MKKQIVLIPLILMAALNANAWWVSWGHMKSNGKVMECVDSGFCAGGFKSDIKLYDRKTDFRRQAEVDIKIEGSKMVIIVKKLIGAEKDKNFMVSEDVGFDMNSAKKLKYKSIILKKGEYPIEYSKKYPSGRIIVQIIARK